MFIGSFVASEAKTSVRLQLDSKGICRSLIHLLIQPASILFFSGKQATITLSGPAGGWFSVGFGATKFAMSDKPYSIVVEGNGKVSERKLGDHDPGNVIAGSIKVIHW